jgi:hypothetical protein
MVANSNNSEIWLSIKRNVAKNVLKLWPKTFKLTILKTFRIFYSYEAKSWYNLPWICYSKKAFFWENHFRFHVQDIEIYLFEKSLSFIHKLNMYKRGKRYYKNPSMWHTIEKYHPKKYRWHLLFPLVLF